MIPQARGTGAYNASHALRLCTDAFWLLDVNNDGIITKAELDAQDVSEAFRGVRFGQSLRSVSAPRRLCTLDGRRVSPVQNSHAQWAMLALRHRRPYLTAPQITADTMELREMRK